MQAGRGDSPTQWISRVSAVSESEREGNRRERIAGCPAEALEMRGGGVNWISCGAVLCPVRED